MRRAAAALFSLVLAGLVALGATPAQAGTGRAATSVGADLLLFEQNVKWEVVSREWVHRRPGWVDTVANTRSPRELADAVVQLETNMGWESVDKKWRSRRDGWLADAKRASSMASVARLLLELESVTRWEAVQEEWKDVRPGWVDRLSEIADRR